MLNYKSETGITIIEALIAILILGMIVSSMMLVNQQSFQITTDSKMRTAAVNLARERLESLKYLDVTDPNTQLTRDSDIWQDNDNLSETIPVNGINYTVITTIPNTTNVNSFFNDNKIIPIRVTVQWPYNGANRSITMDTCYSQYGN